MRVLLEARERMFQTAGPTSCASSHTSKWRRAAVRALVVPWSAASAGPRWRVGSFEPMEAHEHRDRSIGF